MKNPFFYTDSNKRYHTYSYALKKRFNNKVIKITLDAGMTCPNIDGSKGFGGCTYCSERGSADFSMSPTVSLKQQFDTASLKIKSKIPNCKFIAYFQAHSNTYAPLENLKSIFEQVLSWQDIVGISIATRADCISEEIADYLLSLSKKTYLEVELGLQSVHNTTANRINRCHNYKEFLDGFHLLKMRSIPVCVHIINGLPGETPEMMLETAYTLGQIGIDCIKIHLLYVLKNTKISHELSLGEFNLLSREKYIEIVCNQLEVLPPEIIVQRLTGDAPKDLIIGPLWSMDKLKVLNGIDIELAGRDSFQGKNYCR